MTKSKNEFANNERKVTTIAFLIRVSRPWLAASSKNQHLFHEVVKRTFDMLMRSIGAIASLSRVDRMIACNAVAWYMPESVLGLAVTLLFALATLSLISIAFVPVPFQILMDSYVMPWSSCTRRVFRTPLSMSDKPNPSPMNIPAKSMRLTGAWTVMAWHLCASRLFALPNRLI